MKPILHIIKNPSDKQAVEIIGNQAKDNAYGVAVVLMHNAATLPPIPNARTCALIGEKTDLAASINVHPDTELISYDDLLKLIFSVESVTVW